MPKTADLARLFRAIGSGDLKLATRAAQEMAAAEERLGRRAAAQVLRGSLSPNVPHRTAVEGDEILEPAGREDLVFRERCDVKLEHVMLGAGIADRLLELVEEWRLRSELARHGVKRRTTLLLHGPSGCGKTMTARALGNELSLPVLTVRLSSIIGSYLGQTAGNLRRVFEIAHTRACILFLDEFDALARARGEARDIAEIDRVVISLLQELDHAEPAGFVVAATNLEAHIDPALWRRFSLRLEFPKPMITDLKRFARIRLQSSPSITSSGVLAALKQGLSYSDVDDMIADEVRRAIIQRAH